jgi:hypothetical protein
VQIPTAQVRGTKVKAIATVTPGTRGKVWFTYTRTGPTGQGHRQQDAQGHGTRHQGRGELDRRPGKADGNPPAHRQVRPE